MKKLIRSNSKGQLFYNIHKNEFYIEFGTVRFTLHMDDYLTFERYLKKISSDMTIYSNSDKINIPISQLNIMLLVTPEELLSLRDLFGFKTTDKLNFKMKINYSMN